MNPPSQYIDRGIEIRFKGRRRIRLCEPIQVRQQHHKAQKTKSKQSCFCVFAQMKRMHRLLH